MNIEIKIIVQGKVSRLKMEAFDDDLVEEAEAAIESSFSRSSETIGQLFANGFDCQASSFLY